MRRLSQSSIAIVVALLSACQPTPLPPPPPPPISDAGPPKPPDRLTQLAADAARIDTAAAWRAYADELSKGAVTERAAQAYATCAFKAGEDFEASLYCQAAAATLHKILARRDGGATP